MSDISKNKFIASLAGMFAVGALAGTLATSALTPHAAPIPEPKKGGQPPSRDWKPFHEFLLENLRKDVGLTDAQATNLAPVALQLEKAVDQVRMNSFKEMGSLIGHFNTNSVLPILTAEQIPLFEKMIAEMGKRGGRGGRGGGGPPRGEGKPPGDKPPEKNSEK